MRVSRKRKTSFIQTEEIVSTSEFTYCLLSEEASSPPRNLFHLFGSGLGPDYMKNHKHK